MPVFIPFSPIKQIERFQTNIEEIGLANISLGPVEPTLENVFPVWQGSEALIDTDIPANLAYNLTHE